jgi:L-malate glycosyltransferase
MSSDKIKIRILHIETSIAFTGGFKSLLNFCLHSRNNIHSVVILKKGSANKGILEQNGIKVYELPLIEISKRLSDIFLYFPFLILNSWRIRRIAKTEKTDILHSNDLYCMALHMTKYLFFLKNPLIVHIRMMPASFPHLIYQIWRFINVHLADQLVGVSFAVKKSYGNPENMEVVYDVDTGPEKHPDYQYSFKKDRPFNFINLANYIYGKGQDLALDAFEILIRRNPNVTLTFVGGDMGMSKNIVYKNKLIDQVVKMKLTDKIFFEDFVQDVEVKLKKYDASLNFSYSESFSQVSYESLRYGIPFISSDCGGPAELFVNGDSGLLAKNKSVDEMAEAMYQLSTDIELGKKFSINSKKYINDAILSQAKKHTMEALILECVNKKSNY